MKTLIFTVGIMGSGKSTYMSDKHPVVETDGIRKELFGDVNNITEEKLVFDTAIDRIVEHFKTIDTVYLDATMVETKHRVVFLNTLKTLIEDIKLIGMVFNVDPEIAKVRIQNDIDSGIDRADGVKFVDEYYGYYKETMELISKNEILFTPIMV